jgi:hypothetical protein
VEALNAPDVISSYSAEIHNIGNLMLSSTGMLINSANLTLKANLGIQGPPCVDPANQRAYLVNTNSLRAFDTVTGNATGSLTLPTTGAVRCIRWGLDGFAILGNDGKIQIARWSATIPTSMDSDADGVSDAWEAAQFNSLGENLFADPDGDGMASVLEYLFATTPGKFDPACLKCSMVSVASGNFIKLVFPRRTGTAGKSYGYECSDDLAAWTSVVAAESVLSTQTVDGASVETVQALIAAPAAGRGYVRLKSTGR